MDISKRLFEPSGWVRPPSSTGLRAEPPPFNVVFEIGA
jgi:hypothetical protein